LDTRPKFNAERYDQDGEWKFAYLPESNHYQRIGLDPEGQYSSQEIDEAYQVRVNWWKARKKQRDKGEESNPLVKKVGPYIDDALKYLGQASGCLLNAEKKDVYDRSLEKSRTDEKEAKLLGFIAFTLRDTLLTTTERRDLLEQARELGITSQRAEQLIWQQMAQLGAREVSDEEVASQASNQGRVEAKVDPPQLVVSQTTFSLGTLRKGEKRECIFATDNKGAGILRGNIEVSDSKWLKVSDVEISGRKHHQDIKVFVDTSRLHLGSNYTGMIYIHSNGGESAIRIDLSIEIEKSALSRYSRSAFWLGILVGGIFGYFLYVALPDLPSRAAISGIAGLVGLIGAIVAASRSGGFVGGCGTFLIGAAVLTGLETALPHAYAAVSWALIFGSLLHTLARFMFVAKESGKAGAFVGVGVAMIFLVGGIIIAGTSLKDLIRVGDLRNGLPPVQMGTVSTCKKATGWRHFTAKSQFKQNEPLCVYADALNVNRDGKIDLTYTVNLKDLAGAGLLSNSSRFTGAGQNAWYHWSALYLPPSAPPGTYIAEVTVRNNLTAQTGSSAVNFTVLGTNKPTPTAAPTSNVPVPETAMPTSTPVDQARYELVEYTAPYWRLSYPAAWSSTSQWSSVMFAPESELVRTAQGTWTLNYGFLVDVHETKLNPIVNQGDPKFLDESTRELIEHLSGVNTKMKVLRPAQPFRVAQRPGLSTLLVDQSAKGDQEYLWLLTAPCSKGILYIVFVSPVNQYSSNRPLFEKIANTVILSE
jgi:hypothetical protein